MGQAYTVLAENDKQAIYWFKKAAEQGYAKAQFTLGRIYDNGKDVRRDVYKAKEFYGYACDNGYPSGCEGDAELNKQGIR
ncbi:tetratricopeptide repeat protein [Bibersteinia trehalosi]|uniref:tetratricopeptide repeat protein n=1 Tax=Bibersteinia trehalosi TaxID=47735 RepID=UPI00404674C7